VKLLLDTHIWLWSLLDPARLTPAVTAALENQENQLWLSPLTVWETLVLIERGRVVLDCGAVEWIERALAAAPFSEATLTHAVALEGTRVVLAHRDPVDHLLAATARAYGLTLITADARLLAGEGFATLANR